LSKAEHFPLRTFRYVYLIILIITLAGLVQTLGSSAPIGFMALIDGEENALIGRSILYGAFFGWALFFFSVYVYMEAFEDKDGTFVAPVKPKSIWIERTEWALRFLLIAAVTIKLWKPHTYQEAMWSVAAISFGLFVWSAVVAGAFAIGWRSQNLLLIVLTLLSAAAAWIASDADREGKYGLLICIVLPFVATVAMSLGLYNLREAFWPGARRHGAVTSDSDDTKPQTC
jgi:hypothetical protein